MCNTLVVPITVISDVILNHCKAILLGQWQHHIQHETLKELCKQGKVLKDILQRIILTARFEDATPPECKVICMWYEGFSKVATYVTFNRNEYPRFKLDHSSYSSGMTGGVYSMSLSSNTITAPFLLNNSKNNLEVNHLKQSVNEQNL